MRAGVLHEQVKIQSKSVTRDTDGGEIITWTDVATVWASIEPLRGQEFLEASGLHANVDHRIRVRHMSGILPSMRVLYGDRAFNINAVIQVAERRREIQLMCQELING